MTRTAIYVITALIAFIIGGGAFVLWFVVSDARERRKHYKVTVAVKPDGSLDVYKSKWTEYGREAITVPHKNDALLLDIDVRLLDGETTITDLRPAKGLDWI